MPDLGCLSAPAAMPSGHATRFPCSTEVTSPRPLYDLEAHLAALIDTEEIVSEELEQEYALELQSTLAATVEKRDRVGQFLAHLESQIDFAHAEIQRLQQRERFHTQALARVKNYVTHVIEGLGLDSKGRHRTLEGNTVTLSLRGCDSRVEVTDLEAVPTKYKRVTVTLPAETWEVVCDALEMDLREQVLGEIRSAKVEVSAGLIKKDLKSQIAIPGTRLSGGTYLVRK